jgi:hypothetical protein
MSDLSAHPVEHASPPPLENPRPGTADDWLAGMEGSEKTGAPGTVN